MLVAYDLIDRYRLDHPGPEMWTVVRSFALLPDSVLSEQSVRTDSDFVTCPTFHWIGQTDHKLVRVNLQFVNWPSLAGYWKFNTSLLEIGDFRERLESLIQWAVTGYYPLESLIQWTVTGNKWWGSLKYRIGDFAIKYGQQLKLDRAKKVKFLDDKLSRAVERGNSLAVDLARRDIEREASERYKGFVVRARLNRVSNEVVKCNAFVLAARVW